MVAQMRASLDDLDIADEEHGAAWLSTDDGLSLEWNGDGRLVFDDGALRRDGCTRGAVAHSVLCRPHHFESIKSRPSPFHD